MAWLIPHRRTTRRRVGARIRTTRIGGAPQDRTGRFGSAHPLARGQGRGLDRSVDADGCAVKASAPAAHRDLGGLTSMEARCPLIGCHERRHKRQRRLGGRLERRLADIGQWRRRGPRRKPRRTLGRATGLCVVDLDADDGLRATYARAPAGTAPSATITAAEVPGRRSAAFRGVACAYTQAGHRGVIPERQRGRYSQ